MNSIRQVTNSRRSQPVSAFANWLSRTALSVVIQSHDWVIPTIQSIHIAAIGIALASVFMMALRVLGRAGRDQSLAQVTARFGPALAGALVVLLATGLVMVVGEPARELLAFSFWLKMTLVALATASAAAFLAGVRRNAGHWEQSLAHRPGIQSAAIATLLLWACIVILGRLIAYDHVWGSWSMSPKA